MQHNEYVPLPVFDTIVKVIIITLIPVAIGMITRAKASRFSLRMERPVKIMSGILLFVIIVAAILNDRENFFDFFAQAGPVALALNVVMLAVGYTTAKLTRLNSSQSITISSESGIQNGTLGIAIAATLLKNPTMTISPAIYSLIMFMTAGLIIAGTNLKIEFEKAG
jgi:bile acid:Na+ symporter, BASS family